MTTKSTMRMLLAAALLLPALPRPGGLERHWLAVMAGLGLLALGLAVAFALAKDANRRRVPVALLAALGLLAGGYLLGLAGTIRPLSQLLALGNRLSAVVLLLAAFAVFREGEGRSTLARTATLALLAHGAGGLADLVIQGPGELVDGATGHANVFAFCLVGLAPWAAGLAADRSAGRWRAAAWTALLLALVLLPFTRSAGGLLAAGGSWGFWLLLSLARRRRGRLLLATLLLVMLGAGLLGTSLLHRQGEIALSGRLELARGGWGMVMESPFAGHGPGAFRFLFPAERPREMLDYPGRSVAEPMNHAHLEPLHTAVEGGALAAGGLLLLAGLALRGAWRGYRVREGFVGGAAPLIALLAVLGHGAVSLAPAREGMVVAMVVLGAALAAVEGGGRLLRTTLPRGVFALAALLLAGTLVLHTLRLAGEAAATRGRDPEAWFAARDREALRRSLALWPENPEARALLSFSLLRAAEARGEAPGADSLRWEALEHAEQLARVAPQYFREPELRAWLLRDLGDPARALQILENSDRFLLHPETKRLREELRERVGKKSREGK